MCMPAAISQRNIMENAAALEAQKDDLLEAMLEFFEEHVQRRFPEADYTFDVYITTAGAVSDSCTSSCQSSRVVACISSSVISV